jgi:hypothetical protein
MSFWLKFVITEATSVIEAFVASFAEALITAAQAFLTSIGA